jgi:hypothetical protein
MSFNGKEGSYVTLREASSWTANYRATIASGDILSQFVGAEKIKAILDQSDCVGIRIYYGIDDDGKKNLILVGANANENDMEDGILVEKLLRCPPECPQTNSLNS